MVAKRNKHNTENDDVLDLTWVYMMMEGFEVRDVRSRETTPDLKKVFRMVI